MKYSDLEPIQKIRPLFFVMRKATDSAELRCQSLTDSMDNSRHWHFIVVPSYDVSPLAV